MIIKSFEGADQDLLNALDRTGLNVEPDENGDLDPEKSPVDLIIQAHLDEDFDNLEVDTAAKVDRVFTLLRELSARRKVRATESNEIGQKANAAQMAFMRLKDYLHRKLYESSIDEVTGETVDVRRVTPQVANPFQVVSLSKVPDEFKREECQEIVIREKVVGALEADDSIPGIERVEPQEHLLLKPIV